MSYQYDVFISYRRSAETRLWLEDHFVPLLKVHVGNEIRRDVKVYWDAKLEAGTSWTAELGQALADSRILIPMWSGSYLASKWCATELSCMLKRQQQTSRATQARPKALIVPAVIHSAPLPRELAGIQALDIVSGYNVRMARNSPGAEQLESEIRRQAPGIARCIDSSPPWRSNWSRTTADALIAQLQKQMPRGSFSVPRFAG